MQEKLTHVGNVINDNCAVTTPAISKWEEGPPLSVSLAGKHKEMCFLDLCGIGKCGDGVKIIKF